MVYKFKRRHELGQIKKHAEDASVDDDVVANAIPKLREVLEPDTTLATIHLKGKKRIRKS
ncbi:42371_t:CDS:2 [Gigaspora margarita]|uniref:42371_t:CDS:1 n=1 Tax=Gigaspora margarita TaxID=4874 RepID=A0ABN7X3W7_GIGMA|nr:42371_t:CDS:2 [Gigaspora margarita]